MATEQQLYLLSLRFIRETEHDLEHALNREFSALEQYMLLLQELNNPKAPGVNHLLASSKKNMPEAKRITKKNP